ncbi:MAG: hypothetical protein IAF58_03005, partial [Leptolyngbya sp.]|nr:hypothetical protein [Candidatus Melainabacteria bacterium]
MAELVRSGDVAKLKDFALNIQDAFVARRTVDAIVALKAANMFDILREIGKSDTHATGAALCELGSRSNLPGDTEFLKKRYESGDLLNLLKGEKISALEFLRIIDHCGADYSRLETATLLDKFNNEPRIKDALAKEMVYVNRIPEAKFSIEPIAAETRKKAMEYLAQSAATRGLVDRLTQSPLPEAAALARNVLMDLWTTEKQGVGTGNGINELFVGDRIHRLAQAFARKSWKDGADIEDLVKRDRAATSELAAAGGDLARKIAGKGATRDAIGDIETNLIWSHLRDGLEKQHPHLAAEFAAYDKATEKEQRAHDELASVLKSRGEAIEAELAPLCKEMGITVPKVRFFSPSPGDSADGSSIGGSNRIILSTRLLNNQETLNAQFLDTLFHEVSHVEQDNLVVRRLADELKIGKTASPAEIDALRDLYAKRQKTERGRSSFFEEVLKVRDGQPLNETQAARADALIESFRDHSEFEARESSLKRRADKLTRTAKEIAGGAPLEKFVSTSDPEGSVKKLLKTKTLTSEMSETLGRWAESKKSQSPELEHHEKELRRLLARKCNSRAENILDGLYSKYASRMHEVEAWTVSLRTQFLGSEAINEFKTSGATPEAFRTSPPKVEPLAPGESTGTAIEKRASPQTAKLDSLEAKSPISVEKLKLFVERVENGLPAEGFMQELQSRSKEFFGQEGNSDFQDAVKRTKFQENEKIKAGESKMVFSKGGQVFDLASFEAAPAPGKFVASDGQKYDLKDCRMEIQLGRGTTPEQAVRETLLHFNRLNDRINSVPVPVGAEAVAAKAAAEAKLAETLEVARGKMAAPGVAGSSAGEAIVKLGIFEFEGKSVEVFLGPKSIIINGAAKPAELLVESTIEKAKERLAAAKDEAQREQ